MKMPPGRSQYLRRLLTQCVRELCCGRVSNERLSPTAFLFDIAEAQCLVNIVQIGKSYFSQKYIVIF
jgi:hypothetical protein